MRLRLDPTELGLSLRRGPSRRERMPDLPEREGLGLFRLTKRCCAPPTGGLRMKRSAHLPKAARR
ncbi:MAG TPA: hypothetical protein VEM38_13500 [Burkholderiales bacterium]|nr:hypothetical protein [Burkholderiales bacterium]